MELFSDVAFLARLQFTLTVAFHFVFVPLSIGVGLVTAIAQTRYYRSRDEEDLAAAQFWLKLFTTTFAIGVATGITMEFSFGTNWADYSRFVGDIFGAPLAAEALFAFFLESVFLGVLLFGRDKVSPRFYCVASWLVWFGSCLSALWILIANSWMQTPAGAEVAADGSKAVLTDFFAAAFNPTTGLRYFHTVTAALVIGGLCAIAVAAYYYMKGTNGAFAKKTMKTGLAVALVATCALFVSAHSTAVGVWEQQPTKLAAMEGQYEDEVPPLYFFGWVDEQNQTVIGPSLPGFTSFLATFTFDTEYPGLNSLAETEQYGAMNPSDVPVGAIFQVYHLMVALSGVILLVLVLAAIAHWRGKLKDWKWLQRLLVIAPLFPFAAIEAGWFTAELGRQPWVVYPSASAPDGVSLLTNEAVSPSVTAPELVLTIVLFCAVYLLLFVAWGRLVARFVKEGPAEALVEGRDGEAPAIVDRLVGMADSGEPAPTKGGE
ncbi:MAG: cytochrome ubiquinol oxidase subunit I [Coriobacteriaceae bacterium]|jgi:cytochrome d ubiquinol oxidase subunit I|nr:cytochrome ubiquinol oxidase subunit I [Coriobacteriaceae bacterium]